jgi:hypothetical protein
MLRIRAGPDDAVDLRDQRLQLFAVSLRQAPGDDELLPAALDRRMFENRFGRFGLGGIDEGARVDDDRSVGAPRVGFQMPSGRTELGDHHLGIDEILGAAQAYETNALH